MKKPRPNTGTSRRRRGWKVVLRGQTRDQLLTRVVTFIAFAAGGMHAAGRARTSSQRPRPDDPAHLVAWANDLLDRNTIAGVGGTHLRDVDFVPPDAKLADGWRAELVFDS